MFDKELTITFKSRTITFHPLTVKHIRNMPDEMSALMTRGGSPFDPERFSKLLKLYTVSAQRGDTSITEEDVETIVDLSNISKINRVILGQNPDEEVVVSNSEETAPRPISPLIGGESMGAS